MKASNENEKPCSELDILSAYFDNELTPDEKKDAEHIQSCEQCKKHLTAFYQIEEGVKKSLTSSVPSDLTQRILDGVHKKLEQEKEQSIPFTKPILFNPIFLRVAASAVVCFGLVLYVVGRYQLKNSKNTKQTVASVSPTTPDSSDDSIRFIDPAKFGYKSDDGNGIPLYDFQTVKYGDSNRHEAAALNSVKRPSYIQNNVKHVWVVNNLDDVRKDIGQFAAKNNIPANKVKVTPNYRGSGLNVNLRLTKRQLVNLVNDCNNDGFSLVSSQAPEPNEKTFVGKENAPVQYNAEFVLAK